MNYPAPTATRGFSLSGRYRRLSRPRFTLSCSASPLHHVFVIMQSAASQSLARPVRAEESPNLLRCALTCAPLSESSQNSSPPQTLSPPVAGTGTIQITVPAPSSTASFFSKHYSTPSTIGDLLWQLRVSPRSTCSGPQLSIYLECLGSPSASQVFIADGIATVEVLPYTDRGRGICKSLPFHLTPASPSAGFRYMLPSSPAPCPTRCTLPSPWRSWTDIDLGLVDASGNVTVSVSVVAHTPAYSRLAALVDRGTSPSVVSAERNWLGLVSAVREETSLVTRCRRGPRVLTLALRHARVDYAQLFLALGADARARDDGAGGITPLQAAVEGGDTGLVLMLVHRFGADVEEKDWSGETCVFRIQSISQRERRKVMLVLLTERLGASLEAVNYRGDKAGDLLSDIIGGMD